MFIHELGSSVRLPKFENLSNILNQDRKDITAKTYLTCCGIGAFPRPKIILRKG